ncbi:hypothetical protein [Jiella sonneratiae]|uniref:Neutral/alkaline non-lysosomal ceramidase N-terminal domain-containing protein n=1 Tax=Jiella sonneratiae TaxID=2816856 RepID=A0ABS3J527_9HYPH|nr:hypothetical protein [Jiella sonneratiae]MBO0904240.1 hypothetical protein [Jiella sonneratiae]
MAAAGAFKSAVARAQDVQSAPFKAGAGRAEVVFADDIFPIDGFVAEHDLLAVRVLLLDDGEHRTAIAVVDLTSITDGTIASFKSILTEIADVSAENALVCASHTFSAPHVFPPDQMPAGTDAARNDAKAKAFEVALRQAAQAAVTAMRPARLGFGEGVSRVSVNRDVETPFGWWLGADDAGFTDPALGIVRLEADDGTPLAIVMNFAVQSSVMDGSERASGGKLISADLAGRAARFVEDHYGADTVALFLVGAAGDQAPYLQAARHVVDANGNVGREDIHETGFTILDLLGERLGQDVVRTADAISMDSATTLQTHRATIEVPGQGSSPKNRPVGPVASFAYEPAGSVDMPVALMRLGDVAIVGVQPELSASIGVTIKRGSPFAHTMVVTMVDGGAKYMADALAYDRYTYEARNSPFAKGAAEMAAAKIIDLLNALKSDND